MLAGAFDIRTKCDYQDFYLVSKEEAEKQLKNAAKFIQMIEKYLERNLL